MYNHDAILHIVTAVCEKQVSVFMEKKKQKKWLKPRHKVITAVVRLVLKPYCLWRYGVKIDRFKEEGNRKYLVLMNHQNPFDQFFVGVAFRQPIYYIATEDIFSLGWVSSLIRYLVAPIPIKKQASDLQAVMTCLRVAKEGGSIGMAPEGNRTYSGRTEYINPAVIKLAKRLKLPVALFRIEGGYGVQPRWSDVIRKGSMRAYVSRVIEPEQCAAMTDEAFYKAICDGLYADDHALGCEFHHPKQAEYLERAFYVCPFCGLARFESHEDIVECLGCGKKIRHLPNLELEGVGCEFPYRTVGEWYDAQKDFVNALDTTAYREKPLFRDVAAINEVIPYKKKVPFREKAAIALYGDRIVFDEGRKNELVLSFAEITALAVLGRNKANIYHGGRVYQMKGDKRFNSLKYVNIYYRNKNISKGDRDGTFLGL